MAIFVYCEECEECVEPNSCEHKKQLNNSSDKISNYKNMRKTLSGTTKMEFNQTTMGDDIRNRGGSI